LRESQPLDVEYLDAGGGYVTTFDGPLAEQRARYFGALKTGQLKIERGPGTRANLLQQCRTADVGCTGKVTRSAEGK
jgi:hypothetical protein